jgi:hypothetical protein
VFHHLVLPEDSNQVVEPPRIMAEVASTLGSVAPQSRTECAGYCQDLLSELGVTVNIAESSELSP